MTDNKDFKIQTSHPRIPRGDSANYINPWELTFVISLNVSIFSGRFKAFLANCPRGWCSVRNHPWVSEVADLISLMYIWGKTPHDNPIKIHVHVAIDKIWVSSLIHNKAITKFYFRFIISLVSQSLHLHTHPIN